MGHGLHVIHDGLRSAPPLLLLHGSGAGSACWGPTIPALARHRHVIRVDLPGCGESPPAPSYAVPAQADAVAAVLDDLGLRSLTVAGHSSGGYVATALAERRPDLVGALALVSTGPDLDAFRRQPPILRMLLSPPIGPLLWRIRSDAVIRKGIASTCARRVHVPDDMIADLRGITFPVLSTVLRENTAYLAERGLPERLAALGMPALVVFGASDPRWEPSSARRYDRARVEMLPGVGHLPMIESPEATAELLLTAG
ncbi:alpha/beta hydrolase [Actinoplanes italicus]|uniref:Pimeloyl-ACP methyl ester carboxylesterase n=1 Tax=Actinoplanes italicus TaxID=113567 RepID=A0A2T0K435_9ACTN|nr:alpha/beta fold hydrolase [Actinoplanes italicus]PRX17652.1 pimeloyl-ACP methyl ester carboxylesterase [Actinoplanes italicus]GIE34665.1 alpha/beta hydrolase [Actinoplanes italicus]